MGWESSVTDNLLTDLIDNTKLTLVFFKFCGKEMSSCYYSKQGWESFVKDETPLPTLAPYYQLPANVEDDNILLKETTTLCQLLCSNNHKYSEYHPFSLQRYV